MFFEYLLTAVSCCVVALSGQGTVAQDSPHRVVTPTFKAQRTQVRFTRPAGMRVSWYTVVNGKGGYPRNALEAPARYNFRQAAVYRLKLSNIEGFPGLEVYPTLEVVPANARTQDFLAHCFVPVGFTEEDFRQVADGHYVVKVIYLPSPRNQDSDAAAAGEIDSTQLERGADPIREALRRGDILLVVRMGGIDQEVPSAPSQEMPSADKSAAQPQRTIR